MEFGDATARDAEAIARVARESLAASYGDVVDEATVDELVERWYSADEIDSRSADENAAFVVVTEDDEPVGFAHGAVVDGEPVAGELDWLHVRPDRRGNGLGVQLLGRMQDELADRGATVLRGLVLAANEDGAAFYEAHGFERAGEREVEIAGESFTEAVYEKRVGDAPDEQVVESMTGPDGAELFVNYSAAERGTIAPLYPVYADRDLEDRHAFRCGNCGALATTMDSAGRVACDECDNARAATRWDDAYL